MSVESPITEAMHWFLGEARTFEFTVVDANGAAKDITGWLLQWTVAESPTAAFTLQKTPTITNAPNGVCQVAIAAADTVSLTPGIYVHTLRKTTVGDEQVLAYGDAFLQDR